MWPAPSMVISPAVVAVEHLVELDPVPGRVGRGDAGHPHREGDDARHPLRVVGGEPQRPPHTIAAQANQHRRLRAGGGQDGLQVGDALLVGVGLGRDRPVGAAVAAPVEGHHPIAAGQVRDLRLPLPGMHDRVGGHQHQGGVATAEHLIVQPHPVPVDVSLPVRFPGPHRAVLLRRPRFAAPASPMVRHKEGTLGPPRPPARHDSRITTRPQPAIAGD